MYTPIMLSFPGHCTPAVLRPETCCSCFAFSLHGLLGSLLLIIDCSHLFGSFSNKVVACLCFLFGFCFRYRRVACDDLFLSRLHASGACVGSRDRLDGVVLTQVLCRPFHPVGHSRRPWSPPARAEICTHHHRAANGQQANARDISVLSKMTFVVATVEPCMRMRGFVGLFFFFFFFFFFLLAENSEQMHA